MARALSRSLLACLLLLVGVRSARADGGSSDVSTYVSDQFKTVALRTFAQLSADAIAEACPEKEPLCDRPARILADAFSAALSKDPVAVRAALGDFFVESSIAALMRGFGSVIPADATTEKKWTQGVRPLLHCVVGRLSGKATEKVCVPGASAGWATALLNGLLDDASHKKEYFSRRDTDALKRTSLAIADGRPMDPVDALGALAAIASSKRVDRKDVRVFLLALSNWAKEGLTDGLFPATYRYLVHFDPSIAEVTTANDIRNGTASINYDFLSDPAPPAPSRSETWIAAARACGKDPTPLISWVATRTDYMTALRTKLLQGEEMDLGPLDAIENMGACGEPAGKPLDDLRRKLLYFRSELRVEQARIQYGLRGLSIAALIDYVRSSDEKQLARNVAAIALLGAARVVLHESNKPGAATSSLTTIEDVMRLCEFQSAQLAFHIPVVRLAGTPGQCLSRKSGILRDQPSAPAATSLQLTLKEQLTEVRSELRSAVDTPSLRAFVIDAHIDTLEHAVALMEADDSAGAQRIVLRLGIDLLVEQVNTMTRSALDVKEEACARDATSRTIFHGLDAACGLHLMIQSAYQPVADFYWNQGSTRGDEAQLATTVYKSLLSTPYLDLTPIILNVGLGGNYIVGATDFWGTHGTTTLTVLDKVGLAFYKHNWRKFRFETGPFVGGFLDALVRVVADESQRYWVAGYTAGTTRMWGTDFGIEVHAGAAMPFAFGRGNQYGFATGAALVVPFNFVLGGDQK